MTRFFILAYLPGTEYALRLVCSEGKALSFLTHQKAQEWAVEELTPDWEWVVVPMLTVEI